MIKKILSLIFDRQFIIYSIIGVSGVALDFIVYLILVKAGIPPVAASLVSVSVGIVNNFFWNAHYNFKRKDRLLQRFLHFYAVGATGVVLSAVIILLLHDIIGMNDIYAKLISVPFIVITQYFLNKNISFADDYAKIPVRLIMVVGIAFISLCVFAFNAPYYNFTDENDNLLGAMQMVSQGSVIYQDYFSHHMPLTYFVAAPLMALFGTNLIAVKVMFGLCMGTWTLIMSRHLLKKSLALYAAFILFIPITQVLAWSHMLLAETLIAYALTHAMILFATRDQERSFVKDGLVYAVLGSIPILSSLSFAPISVLIYSILGIHLILHRRKIRWHNLITIGAGVGLPFLLLIIYFVVTRSFSEFMAEAIRFNTSYYSLFTPEAGHGLMESLLTVPQGAFASLYESLSFSGGAVQPFAFLFTLSIVLSVCVLLYKHRYLESAIFSLALGLAGSRMGFSYVFSGPDRARAGIIVAISGLFLVLYAMQLILQVKSVNSKSSESSVKFFDLTKITISATLLLLLFASISHMSKNAIDYRRGGSTILTVEEAGSPSRVINLINRPSDTYWLGPIDFSSQLITKSRNVSAYRFYPPWVAACPSCTTELIDDIKHGKPRVIVMDTRMSIWGIPVESYANQLITSFDQDYYQVSDIRLRQYYFRDTSRSDINAILSKAGYEI